MLDKVIFNIDVTALRRGGHIRVASNGREYINIVAVMREVDKFGNNFYVYTEPTQEERERNCPKNFCGNGYSLEFDAQGKLVSKAGVKKI